MLPKHQQKTYKLHEKKSENSEIKKAIYLGKKSQKEGKVCGIAVEHGLGHFHLRVIVLNFRLFLLVFC